MRTFVSLLFLLEAHSTSWVCSSPLVSKGVSNASSEDAWWASVHCVRSHLNGVIAEIRWPKRLSEWDHVPHFPYFVPHSVDSMPIASIGGILCDVLFNTKYAGCVYKVTVAMDSLGNIIWICPLAPGTSVDVLIWDREGPKRAKGHFLDYEINTMWYSPLSLERL